MAAAYVSPLECQICTATYDDNEHEPKLLTCHHTLCLSCIVHLANRNIVTCPNKCNQVTALPVLSSEEQSLIDEDVLTRRVKKMQHSFYIDIIRELSCTSSTALSTQKQITGKQTRLTMPNTLSHQEPYSRMKTRSYSRTPTATPCPYPITNRPVTKIGCRGSGPGQFKSPDSIAAVDSKGMMYVSDIINGHIQKFNTDGDYVRHWGVEGFAPILLALNHDRNELVCVKECNRHTNDVTIYSLVGNVKKQFSITNTTGILGMAVNSQGQIVCSDMGKHTISILSRDGDVLHRFGGKESGQFDEPHGVCIGPSDDIIVANGGNCCIQIIDRHGQFKHQFGTEGDTNGQFRRPVSVAVDQYNQILVGDYKRKVVQVFSYTGEFIRCIDSIDDKMEPWGLAVTQDHHVLVIEYGSDRIFKFKYM